MLLSAYNKICKRKEEYNLTDKLILGLCSLIIPLSIWSLFMPSNHIFLALGIGACIVYLGINYRSLYKAFASTKKKVYTYLSSSQTIVFILFVFSSLIFFLWHQEVYDSAFYHFQNIRWNEEYAVVPGIANIDDRFGFNSNYFLLSAIFTFRPIFSEAIYPLQSLIVTAIGGWIVYELFRSGYETKRFIIFITYVLLFWVSIYYLGNTSTDILPNFIIFYLIARLVLHPGLLKINYLIGIILPVFLVTCKLSTLPISIISLYLLYSLIKEKNYKIISFACIISLFIIIPWLIRNVIISGYLIYPLYQIDLFSFDWKVPKEIAIKEKNYIFEVGYYFFRIALRYPGDSIRDPFAINILTDIIYLFTTASFSIFIYKLWKRRHEIPSHIYLLYITFFAIIIVWATGGPDIRFVPGVLCAVIFTGALLMKKRELHLRKAGVTILCCFIISISFWTGSRFYYFYPNIENTDIQLVKHVIVKPFSIIDQSKVKGLDIESQFTKYPINNGQFIRVHSHAPFDLLPPASIDSHYSKFLPLECIEARGYSVQDGYRARQFAN